MSGWTRTGGDGNDGNGRKSKALACRNPDLVQIVKKGKNVMCNRLDDDR